MQMDADDVKCGKPLAAPHFRQARFLRKAICFLRALCGCSQCSPRFKTLCLPKSRQNLKTWRTLRKAAECAEKDNRLQTGTLSNRLKTEFFVPDLSKVRLSATFARRVR